MGTERWDDSVWWTGKTVKGNGRHLFRDTIPTPTRGDLGKIWHPWVRIFDSWYRIKYRTSCQMREEMLALIITYVTAVSRDLSECPQLKHQSAVVYFVCWMWRECWRHIRQHWNKTVAHLKKWPAFSIQSAAVNHRFHLLAWKEVGDPTTCPVGKRREWRGKVHRHS